MYLGIRTFMTYRQLVPGICFQHIPRISFEQIRRPGLLNKSRKFSARYLSLGCVPALD
jgi:hypothetical protein